MNDVEDELPYQLHCMAFPGKGKELHSYRGSREENIREHVSTAQDTYTPKHDFVDSVLGQ